MDRRKRRTRRLLGEALLELVQEKKWDQITIQDITDRADINRATFYLHYSSKEKLLADSLEGYFDELVKQIAAKTMNKPIWENPEADEMVFAHVAEHADLYRVLLGENGMGYVINRVIDYIAQFSELQLRAGLGNIELQLPIEIMARHVAGSLFALVTWWLTNNMPYTPREMAEMSIRLCVTGTMPVKQA
ncbi:TetR/AcrR family transcriptional regulator [Candidatus Leptofilum sp.]|uniref:TetR/AcrR family transcriptional regulator n=1 Tax=Candidatus Leptofilum sp. TaxID=3241576 RepID=UPI003B5A35EC